MPTVYFQYLNNKADLLGALGRYFRKQLGIEVVLFCMSKSEVPNRSKHDCHWDDFSEIVEFEKIFGALDPADHELADWAKRCREIESNTGVSLIEAIRGDRHIGLGYNANIWFPSSKFGRSTNYVRSVAMTCAVAEVLRQRIAADRPIGLFGISGSFAGLVLWKLAEAAGVPCASLTMARSGRAMMLTENLAQWPVGFRAHYEAALRETSCQEASWMETPHRAQANMAGISDRTKLTFLAHSIFITVKDIIARRIRIRFGIYGGYSIKEQLYLVIERWANSRRALSTASTVDAIPLGQPLVFVPLHVDPESTLMVESAPFDNQWVMVDWISKSVPLGWLVVVKDHPSATAPIRSWFWKALRRRPNVVVAGRFEDSTPIVQRSQAVATINGSLGLQAASIGKPVISFQPGYLGSIMDHVIVARDLTETRRFFQRLIDGDMPDTKDRLRSAAAFAEAAKRASIPIDDPGLLSGRSIGKPVQIADVEGIATALCTAFAQESVSDKPAAELCK